MPVPYPKEFRADVVAVARQGDKSRAQVARSFGISESCLARWLQIADRDDGTASSSPATVDGSLEAENRELRQRTKQLEHAVLRRRPSATIVHSDRGSQFRSHAFVQTLRAHGLHGSMGRVGACADNAAMESFFSLLQKNVLDRRRWQTRQQLRLAIITWIENTYHRRRRQHTLGRLTPIEFEILLQAAYAA